MAFETLLHEQFLNITQLSWKGHALTANYGDGWGVGALSGNSSGIRRFAVSAQILPDMDAYEIEYELAGTQTATRFKYYFEFFQRHITSNNKPFLISECDPDSEKIWLVSFESDEISFAQLTGILYGDGAAILVQRRVAAFPFQSDGSVGGYPEAGEIVNQVGITYAEATGTVTRKTGAGAKGASVSTPIAANESGVFAFQIEPNADSTVGLTKSDDDQTETDAEFALKFTYNGINPNFATAQVWIDGVFDADLGYFTAGDIWSLSRENGVVYARKNNIIVGSYTGVNLSASDALYLDIAFGGNSLVANVKEIRR